MWFGVDLAKEGSERSCSLVKFKDENQFRMEVLGNFSVSDRIISLENEVERHLQATNDMNNEFYRFYDRLFRKWCAENGYTKEEIRQAKQRIEAKNEKINNKKINIGNKMFTN